jgi:glutamate synthase (NADPH/NADH) large chain
MSAESRLPNSAAAYRRGIRKGLFKIMSKMGISTIGSYSQLRSSFEIVGLHDEVVDVLPRHGQPHPGHGLCRLGSRPARAGGGRWDRLAPVDRGGAAEVRATAASTTCTTRTSIATLQARGHVPATTSTTEIDARRWSTSARASTLRDLLRLQPQGRADAASTEVESVEAIVKRFDSRGMSLGALSPEAHEALGDCDEPPRCALQLRRGWRETPTRYGNREELRDQAGRARRASASTPEYLIERRSAADQGRPGRQARRGRPAARRQGQRDDRPAASRDPASG